MDGLTIGQVAQRAGVGVETIRFYERQGLVPPAPRTPAGYRTYSEQTIERLGFIQRAKVLGFTLAEVKELLALKEQSIAPGVEVRERAEAKIADVETKIRDLQRMRADLQALAGKCEAAGEGACPILVALSGTEKDQLQQE